MSAPGQGLAIARTIVEERHHGDLRFETEAGVGTTFLVRLPIDGTRPKTAAPPPPAGIPGASGKELSESTGSTQAQPA